MKASFIKRFGAFVIDTFILSIIFSLISMGFATDTKSISQELTKTLEKFENEEITIEEYSDKVNGLNYELQRKSLVPNILNIVLYVGYFIVFGYLNKGQTLGKKICKIKVVNDSDDKPSIWNIIVRSLFIYGIITLLYSVIFVNILNKNMFSYGNVIVTYMESIFMIVAFFMVLYRKDGRGLHDMMAKTKVIEEVK